MPDEVQRGLYNHFDGASGVEWSVLETRYEAIFFHEEIEKIAHFDTTGKLTGYRVNIFPDSIPSPIREAASAGHEIMNCIAIYTADKLTYELIVRDTSHVRYHLLLDSLGNRLGMSKL